jgi:hypothetical protein
MKTQSTLVCLRGVWDEGGPAGRHHGRCNIAGGRDCRPTLDHTLLPDEPDKQQDENTLLDRQEWLSLAPAPFQCSCEMNKTSVETEKLKKGVEAIKISPFPGCSPCRSPCRSSTCSAARQPRPGNRWCWSLSRHQTACSSHISTTATRGREWV